MIGATIHLARRLVENLRADRHAPPLARLAATTDPERFVWSVLPYAARSFSFCIAVLPPRMARTLAVAYLYCRMLDTCEDLPADAAAKDAALAAFLARFAPFELDSSGGRALLPPRLAPPPVLDPKAARDARDSVYLLLLAHADRVDRVFVTLPVAHQAVVVSLVRRMGGGMRWAVATFGAQGGMLRNDAQLSRYCFEVLGHPMCFAEELARVEMGKPAVLAAERVALAAEVGEAIQLANVARDLEKDTAQGVCYLPELAATGRPASVDAVAAARRKLLRRALTLGPRFAPFMAAIPSPRISLARAGGLLMALFTLAFWQGTAERLALPIVTDRERVTPFRSFGLVVRSVFSRASFVATLVRLEAAFTAAGRRLAALDERT
ncbi:MAG: hypothetical protein EXS13_04880 [Planctomycetes bacterium]|nr:hypothetical protein [Planctomycetota bacterium]